MKQLIDIVEGIFDTDIIDKADTAAATPIRDLNILRDLTLGVDSFESVDRYISYYFDVRKVVNDSRKHKPMKKHHYQGTIEPFARLLFDIPGGNWIEDSAEMLRGYLKKGMSLEIRDVTRRGQSQKTFGVFYIYNPEHPWNHESKDIPGLEIGFYLNAHYDI